MPFWRKSRAALPVAVAEIVKPAQAKPEPKFSPMAKQVWAAYKSLPVEHRPAYDLQASLLALDFKYAGQAETHLEHWTYGGWDEEAETLSLTACECLADYDTEGYFEDYREGTTCSMPEYLQLFSAMQEIHEALADRKRIVEEQERQAKLMGLEYELRDVEELTAALRTEVQVIRAVTEEIFVPRTALEVSA